MAPYRIRFGSIPSNDLVRVKGGASRVTSRSSSGNDQLTTMLTQITSSIQNLSGNKSSQNDPMSMMMMMMMMMGGGPGGGGGAQVAAAPPPPPAPPPGPVVNISTRIQH